MRADLDHRPSVEQPDVGQDDALLERIRTEIRRDGPMPFARFMDLALYDPAGGYYRSPEARPGRGGDFLTAPELDPIFGASLAVAVADVWDRLGRPDRFVVREHGSGDGALAEAILSAAGSMPLGVALRYQAVEVDPRRVERLRERLAAAGLADHLESPDAGPFDGVVLGNEILDALPVHRVRQRAGRLREVAVAVAADGSLVETEIEPSSPALAARLVAEGITLVDGQTADICLALDDWIEAASAPLRRGLLLLIDYGAPASELYDPIRRRDGTLRAYVRHRVHDDPYRHVGRQDLTAHVDVTAVERAAASVGLTSLGSTTQAEALMGLGIEQRLRAIQADPTTTIERYTVLRSALMRLLDPAAMGRFVVMAFARDWPDDAEAPPLGLFAYRLPERPRRRP
ncbi:MAG TPA: SAM-dependent methyltransferase [Candidatus Limnocylindrales bacterium]|nr:SAM-dependent methyltransferase [Candidatus Limnocylindrales bacterium]